MSAPTDPTFYRTPAEAIAAPPERLAYVAAYDPAGKAKDAMAVIDTDAASSTYGKVVGLTELPTAGNELHHFGWNACSSALSSGPQRPRPAAGTPLPDRPRPALVAHLCARHQARPAQPQGGA